MKCAGTVKKKKDLETEEFDIIAENRLYLHDLHYLIKNKPSVCYVAVEIQQRSEITQQERQFIEQLVFMLSARNIAVTCIDKSAYG